MNQYQRMYNILIEKSITAMQRAGEFDDDDNPLTPRAKEKQTRSLERAEATIARANRKAGYSSEGNPDDSSTASDRRADRGARARRRRMGRPTANRKGIRQAPSREAAQSPGRKYLRVPKSLKGDEETHRTAAVISRRTRFTQALTKGLGEDTTVPRNKK